MAEGGKIIRIIGGKSTWIAEKRMDIIATEGDVVFSSPKRVNLEGIEGGREIGVYDWVETQNEEEKITNCAVYFSRCSDYMSLSKSERSGETIPDETKIYGFDWMKDEYEDTYGYYVEDVSKSINDQGRVESQKDVSAKFSDLEKEYDPIEIAWKKKKKYYTPWLGIAEGQTVRLQLSMDWDDKPTTLKWDENHLHSDKLELPDAQSIEVNKKKREIQIKCIAPIEEEIEIRLLADDTLAGRLKIVPNKKRTLKVTWCLVDLSGKNKKDEYIDIEALKNKLTQQKINRFVKYLGLSQAVVDVDATETYQTLKLSDLGHTWDEFTKQKGFIYNGSGIIRDKHLLQLTKVEYEKSHTKDNNHLVIFLYNNYKPKINTSDRKYIAEIPNQKTQGQAFAFGSKYCALYDGFDRNYTTVVHELLHCLGLYHSFDKSAKHKFKAYETDNFMDYSYGDEKDGRSMLWKWQWERIWSYIDKK